MDRTVSRPRFQRATRWAAPLLLLATVVFGLYRWSGFEVVEWHWPALNRLVVRHPRLCFLNQTCQVDDFDYDTSLLEQRGTVRLVLDSPSPAQPLSGAVRISGWAADLAAAGGTGVDEVWLWYRRGESDLVVIGRAEYGLPRPDLARAYTDERFERAGFTFDWTAPALSAGSPTVLVVAARSGSEWRVEQLNLNRGSRSRRVTREPTEVSPDAKQVSIAGLTFLRIETAAATIYSQPETTAAHVITVKESLDRAAREGPGMLGLSRPKQPVDVYLMPDEAAYQRAAMDLQRNRDTDSAGTYYGAGSPRPGILLNTGAWNNLAELAESATHEYVHHLVANAYYWGAQIAWLNEGIADYAAYLLVRPHYPEPDSLDAARQEVFSAQAAGTLARMDQLESYRLMDPRSDSEERRKHLVYVQGMVAVELLARRHGLTALAPLSMSGDGSAWQRSFTTLTGVSPRRFHEQLLAGITAMRGVSPVSGRGGDRFALLLDGFKPGEPGMLILHRPDGRSLPLGMQHGGDGGTIATTFRVEQDAPPGEWRVEVKGIAHSQAQATFTIEQRPSTAMTGPGTATAE